jgi:inner membrane protease subunit 1
LPGDVICVDPTGQLAPSTEHVVVPKGHIWVSGDNAADSRDSRLYGPVPMALIHGRLFARVNILFVRLEVSMLISTIGLASKCYDHL